MPPFPRSVPFEVQHNLRPYPCLALPVFVGCPRAHRSAIEQFASGGIELALRIGIRSTNCPSFRLRGAARVAQAEDASLPATCAPVGCATQWALAYLMPLARARCCAATRASVEFCRSRRAAEPTRTRPPADVCKE